ncbi:pyridoxal-dependent decarboxylase, exosortase A system-associated [Denitromonas iodatirespirans]|uniref:Pyridoxal-dependent decarboxylase, exosortase A system-associated n=1 Tax=Denitromonas iodatirespirans TaxID=2795389 RepID=A0A944HAH6_DENI1|nr:pyridoxal-dependent decarboxylase, exosortase A system-associated [Denitromonas iodatirespirans]MBT0960592.1 pyridoxal-dependent decarboxylase, exosortase A system-associated [Denitromonas iodatirespirans]
MTSTPRSAAAHAPIDTFPVAGSELIVGGQPLSRLAARIGQTPFYAYERAAIDRRIAELRAALPVAIKLHYAMKANPMPVLVAHMRDRVDGIDVASIGEMKVALDAGVAPTAISFAGPGKRETELRQAAAAGILLNVESEQELDRLAAIAVDTGWTVRVALRVNPDFELKASGMQMSGGSKPFGIDAERIPAVLARVAKTPLQFEGFHIFSGSQNLRAEAIIEAQQKSFALAVELAAHAPAPVRSLNLGGGLGIPYFPGNTPLDLAPIGANLAQIAEQARHALPEAQLCLELGRYLVGEAGIYVCRVTDRKVSRGLTYLVTDGGLHHHLSASGNFGQVLRKNYPLAIGNRMDAPADELVSVVGPLCTPLDLLGERMLLAHAEIGDLVVVFQSGAYGATASPQQFLGHPGVVEVLV